MSTTKSRRHRVLALACTALVTVGMGVLSWRPRARLPAPPAGQVAVTKTLTGSALVRWLPPGSALLQRGEPAPEGQASRDFNKSGGTTDISPNDAIRDRVMASHPDIAQFRHLQRKVLQSAEERQSLRAMYADHELIQAAKFDLLATNESTYSEDASFKRLYRVEYVGMSMDWQQNPERESLAKNLEEIILAENIHSGQELELQRSLAGDKVELFMILLHYDTGRALALLDKVHDTDLQPLLDYARTRYDVLQSLGNKG